jgi:hypothetical protein
MRLSWLTATTIGVQAGQCRNSSNVNDITIASNLTLNAATTGANGLDTGALANSTFYAVYAIGDSTGYQDGACVASTTLTAPLLPEGYDMYRRIGYILTSGAAAILEFRQDGESEDRWMWYDTAIATDITAGASATYAAVSLVASIPALTTKNSLVTLLTAFTPTSAADKLALRPGDSSSTNGYVIVSCDVAGVAHTSMQTLPFDATTGVDYKVTGTAVALSVAAYLDQLA